MSAMAFNLSETMIVLAYVFSRLRAENDHSEYVVTGDLPRMFRDTLMLLKPLNGMRFNVLGILSGGQYLLFSQHLPH